MGEFLVEFLPGADTGENNFDVLFWPEAREQDEIAGQIQNPDRLAHVQNEDLATLAHGGSLNDELGGLRDRHEVPAHLWMRDGDGLARGDLLFEKGKHASVAAQDVAETDGDILRAAVLEGVDQQLGDALGNAHDAGRADRLVGRDHDEVGDPVLRGGDGDIPGPDHVVLDGFEHVGLHQGDVLVGRGVVEDRRTIFFENLGQTLQVADIADLGIELEAGKALAHLAVDIEEGGFRAVVSDDGRGAEPGDLAAQLGTDGPGRAGDGYHFVFNLLADSGFIEMHGIAAEQVLHVDVADTRGEAAGFEDFRKAGDGFVSDASLLAALEDGSHFPAGGGGQGNEDHVDAVGLHNGWQRLAVSKDLGAINRDAGLSRIVVDETGYVVGERGILPDFAQQGHPRVARSVDEGPFFFASGLCPGELKGHPRKD